MPQPVHVAPYDALLVHEPRHGVGAGDLGCHVQQECGCLHVLAGAAGGDAQAEVNKERLHERLHRRLIQERLQPPLVHLPSAEPKSGAAS